MPRSLLSAIVFVAGLAAGCSSAPKAEFPQGASSARELARLDMDIQKAKARQHDLLAPREIEQSEKYLNNARRARANDTDLALTWQNLSYARGYLDLARQKIAQREDHVQDVLDARGGALNSGARRYRDTGRELASLDSDFKSRAKDLDDGKRDENFWSRLKDSYQGLEVAAVQERHLGPARRLVAEARTFGAARYSPRTLNEATLDIDEAEKAIAANPRSVNAYRSAVLKATDSARWLIAVNATARNTAERTDESIARELVRRNDRAAGREAELAGAELEAELNRRALVSSAVQLQQTSGELAEERSLSTALDEARKRFSSDEADVYRDGDKLLIQLKKMGFPKGGADVPAQSRPLLSKVKGVIDELKAEDVVVRGHADAAGSPKVKRQVSEARAEKVADFIVNTTNAKAVRAEGVTDTKSGRLGERRVDVIITPKVSY